MKSALDFTPTYAASCLEWQFNPSNTGIEVILTKTKKPCGGFPWGFPGGKEDLEKDEGSQPGKGSPHRTARREWTEETGLVSDFFLSKFFTSVRRNDDLSKSEFSNYFFQCRGEDGSKSKRDPERQIKDNVEEVGWFSLKETENLPLKLNHRAALIEFCYLLEDQKTIDGRFDKVLEDLAYKYFERPSEVNGEILVKDEFKGVLRYFVNEKLLKVLPSKIS